jgi:hypothetical protein
MVKITAVSRQYARQDPNQTFTLLCALDHEDRVVKGEWMGYSTEKSSPSDKPIRYPFIWNPHEGVFDQGWEEGTAQRIPTTFGREPVAVGQLFSTRNDPEFDARDKWEITWEILTIHTLEEMTRKASADADGI